MTDNKHNGWTNYATWRIALEIFDCHDPGEEVDHEYCKFWAEEIVFGEGEDEHGIFTNSLAHSYAHAFMSDVNWHEIAEHINEAYFGETVLM